MAGRISKKCIWKQMRRNLGKWFESYRLLQGEQIFHLRDSERWVAWEYIYDSDARRTFYMYMKRGKENVWTGHHSEGYNPKWLTFELLSYLLHALSQLIKVNFFHSCKRIPDSLAEITASTIIVCRFYILQILGSIPFWEAQVFLIPPCHPQYNYIFIHNVL